MARLARSGRIAAAIAIVWGLGAGILSVAWALGSDIALDQLGTRIQEQAREREPAFVAMIAGSATARFLVAVLGFALLIGPARGWSRRPLLVLGYLGGAGLTIYGIAGMIQAALAKTGVIATPSSMGEDAVIWYLLVWEPLWLVAGLALLVATGGF